jgi:hypothetical protein
MKINHITAEFVRSFPSELEPGRLYVSTLFSIASHLCACGCRREVVTPLSPVQWVLTFDGSVSVRPSIGNWALPCQSHYLIERGEVRWVRGFTREEIQRNRESDHRLLDTTHADDSGLWTRVLRRVTSRRRP